MIVVYSTSDSYAEITGISMLSLMENNKNATHIDIYVINNNISAVNKEHMISVVTNYGRKITFIEQPTVFDSLDFQMEVGRWHISTFFRLFLGSVLPQSINKLFYIDSDTIIRKSIEDLWHLNLGEYSVAGADDFRSDNYRRNIELDSGDTYINNGFMLIDLEKWRHQNVEHDFLNFIIKYQGNITYMDQGVLNGVLGKRKQVLELPPKYNAQTIFFDFTYEQLIKLRKPEYHASKQDFDSAVNDPTVVHFTTSFLSGLRPWMKNCKHPFVKDYIYFKSVSPWREIPLRKDDRRYGKKIMSFVSRLTPRFILIPFMSLLHSKIYPWIRNRKQRN